MDMSNNINNMKDHNRIAKTQDRCNNNNNNMMKIKSQTTNNNNNKKINPNPKEYSWNYYNTNNSNQTGFYDQDREDYMINAFSWPPRSYTCSFCKREFRSAQALGGHMNVHRKDRARLRQSPPLPPRDNNIIHQYGRYGSSSSSTTTTPTFLNLNLNHNPNPNPNFSPSHMNISTASPFCSTLTHSKPPLSSLLPSPYSAHDINDIESKKWPWTSTNNNPVEYGTSTDQYHVELDHHDDEYSLINLKGRDKKMSVCGVGSEELHEGLAGKGQVYHCKALKKKMMAETASTPTSVRLDLEIGLLREHEPEIGRDYLDLELRLGYSN